ncbi:hypothetical protein ScPMuIL_002196 [Solemya velum]
MGAMSLVYILGKIADNASIKTTFIMAGCLSMSEEVSRVLDWVGFSEEEIQWRRDVYRQWDTLSNIRRDITHRGLLYTTGSRAEGVGVDMLDSDTDIMFELTDQPSLIHSCGDWVYRPGVGTLFVDVSGVHPGYCRLVRMYDDSPEFVDGTDPYVRARFSTSTVYVCHGDTVVLRSDMTSLPGLSTHGPAQTLCTPGECDIDGVRCLQLPWPPSAREWKERHRPSNYPPREFIHRSRNIHVVRTGYKGSRHRHTEWRFSFSLVELELVQMWPTNVSRCYVLLKLLKRTITSQFPHLSDILCSYHLKTIIFWLMEFSGIDVCTNCSLEMCFVLAVGRLKSWVERGVIPQYFIKTNNLFDLEVGTPRHGHLVFVLRAVMSEGLGFLLRCVLYRGWCAHMRTNFRPGIRNHSTVHERVHLHIEFAYAVDCSCYAITQRCSSGSFSQRVSEISEVIAKLSVISGQQSDGISRSVRYIRDCLRSTHATQILSFLRQNTVSNATSLLLIRSSEQLFKQTVGHEYCLLKQANFYYQLGKYRKAIQILNVVSDMAGHRALKVCYFDSQCVYSKYQEKTLAESNSLFTGVSTSVMFMLPEIHVTPSALKFEAFKPDFEVCTLREECLYETRTVAMIDSDVLLYYLQYLCYTQTREQAHAQVAFDNICWAVKQRNVLQRHTALNILGHCYKERGQFRQAVNCFVKSIQVEPKCNIAAVHLAILLGKAMGRL